MTHAAPSLPGRVRSHRARVARDSLLRLLCRPGISCGEAEAMALLVGLDVQRGADEPRGDCGRGYLDDAIEVHMGKFGPIVADGVNAQSAFQQFLDEALTSQRVVGIEYL